MTYKELVDEALTQNAETKTVLQDIGTLLRLRSLKIKKQLALLKKQIAKDVNALARLESSASILAEGLKELDAELSWE